MSYEGYAQALKARRGRGMDLSSFQPMDMGPEMNAGPQVPESPMAAQPQAPAPAGNDAGIQEALEGSEHAPASSVPQLAPTGAGDQLQTEMDNQISGNGTREDYERMTGTQPQSLGERARFAALKKKFGGK